MYDAVVCGKPKDQDLEDLLVKDIVGTKVRINISDSRIGVAKSRAVYQGYIVGVEMRVGGVPMVLDVVLIA